MKIIIKHIYFVFWRSYIQNNVLFEFASAATILQLERCCFLGFNCCQRSGNVLRLLPVIVHLVVNNEDVVASNQDLKKNTTKFVLWDTLRSVFKVPSFVIFKGCRIALN